MTVYNRVGGITLDLKAGVPVFSHPKLSRGLTPYDLRQDSFAQDTGFLHLHVAAQIAREYINKCSQMTNIRCLLYLPK